MIAAFPGICWDEVKHMNETIPLPEPTELPREVPHSPAPTRPVSARLRAAVALPLCTAVVLCKIFVPDGAKQLRRWIVGDGSERLQQAVFRLERSLGEGDDLAEAWSAFRAELRDETA